jgi:hypothetical protein
MEEFYLEYLKFLYFKQLAENEEGKCKIDDEFEAEEIRGFITFRNTCAPI